jgi:hypothetical protein
MLFFYIYLFILFFTLFIHTYSLLTLFIRLLFLIAKSYHSHVSHPQKSVCHQLHKLRNHSNSNLFTFPVAILLLVIGSTVGSKLHGRTINRECWSLQIIKWQKIVHSFREQLIIWSLLLLSQKSNRFENM